VTMAADYYVGLDLGQAVDFTALAVLERPPGTGLARNPGVVQPVVGFR
jgi:hypothetical protein